MSGRNERRPAKVPLESELGGMSLNQKRNSGVMEHLSSAHLGPARERQVKKQEQLVTECVNP